MKKGSPDLTAGGPGDPVILSFSCPAPVLGGLEGRKVAARWATLRIYGTRVASYLFEHGVI